MINSIARAFAILRSFRRGERAKAVERMEALVAVGTEHEVREAIRTLVPEYSEFTPRVPFADVEVPLGTTGVAAIRRATAPVANPLETGMTPVNIVRAS